MSYPVLVLLTPLVWLAIEKAINWAYNHEYTKHQALSPDYRRAAHRRFHGR
jgi:hypothetical protein